MGSFERRFCIVMTKMSRREIQPIAEMYMRIQDGFIRWMRIAGVSQRDEFRGE